MEGGEEKKREVAVGAGGVVVGAFWEADLLREWEDSEGSGEGE